MATVAKTVYPHITKDPGVCSGRACVEGTRIRVMDIVAMRREGLTPEQIVEEFTSLSGVEDVYAALLYYRDHKEEIEADFADAQRVSEEAERREEELLKQRQKR
jgi:uncharacterized protein (DUF433 family)